MKRFDIAIVGAGMAGASLAAELSPHAQVIVLEAEAFPGYHSTGRSAAFWSETYGGPWVQPLTSASGPFLADPSPDFWEQSFLSPRGELNVGRAEDAGEVNAFRASFDNSHVRLDLLDRAAVDKQCDFMAPEWDRAVSVPSCADIDVAALHQAYLRAARRGGAVIKCNAPLRSAACSQGCWTLDAGDETVFADLLINAAGAWADEVADLAGVKRIGISPFRRTVLQITIDRVVPGAMPLIIDVGGSFYFKPDGGGGLWLSPHDETLSPACDVAPEEIDIAIAVDRFERVTTARVKSVSKKWAGLRSFVPDRLPVYGHDPKNAGFFWCAGQGGFGIQTAPAAAKLAASTVLGRNPDPVLSGIDPARYAPDRFTSA